MVSRAHSTSASSLRSAGIPGARAAENGHPDPGDLLTADDVAALLRVTPAWVYAETRRRRIPHMRLGRYVRFRRSALEGWMEEMERSSTLRPSRLR
jgi:excisionase family DNA binding protein